MAEITTLARPYAEAAFKRAKQTDSVQEWADVLQFLATLVQNTSLAEIVSNPKVSKEKLTALFLDISQDLIHKEGQNLVKLLIENGKLSLLPNISSLFESLRANDEGYVNVQLYSAFSLTKAEQTKYSAMLEKQLQKKVRAVVSVDKSLIGGIIAIAGDKVIDGSIRGQIHQLAKRL